MPPSDVPHRHNSIEGIPAGLCHGVLVEGGRHLHDLNIKEASELWGGGAGGSGI